MSFYVNQRLPNADPSQALYDIKDKTQTILVLGGTNTKKGAKYAELQNSN